MRVFDRHDHEPNRGCDRIFDPFPSAEPAGEGTGPGLDVFWRIVVNKRHGSLQVQSVPGNTRFLVRASP
ncbi:hypothetical protein [Streptosporangium sp. 'caverna']|uniref:hypothetical protein n=1 Tax=Streptosporangium sp. 'caverna' TaxID=2202249 RepID=UPI000D7E2404|nr:hypothetical protein [Streptosporangium sp. 'caverna']AWS43815.1 hypothetical protein DKM19_23145 [Streptosporangium sp. 'caverna']